MKSIIVSGCTVLLLCAAAHAGPCAAGFDNVTKPGMKYTACQTPLIHCPAPGAAMPEVVNPDNTWVRFRYKCVLGNYALQCADGFEATTSHEPYESSKLVCTTPTIQCPPTFSFAGSPSKGNTPEYKEVRFAYQCPL